MVYHRSDSGGSSSASSAARRHSESSRGSARDEERPKSRDDREDSKYSSDCLRGSSRYKDGRYTEGSRSRNGKDDGKYGDSSRYSKDSRSGDGREEGKYYDRYWDGRDEGSRYREGKDDGRYSESSSRYSDTGRYQEGLRHSDNRYSEGSRYSSGGSRFSSGGGNGDSWHSESSRYRDDSRYYGRGSSRYRGEDGSGYSEREGSHYGKEDTVTDDLAANTTANSDQEKLTNVFQNDGSFLEMFKKMQEASNKTNPETVENPASEISTPETSTSVKKEEAPRQASAVPRRGVASGIVGKRRGGRVLPTGMVKKQKREEEEEETPKDAWSLYMAEVRKYKEASCEEEGKTRPLVK